MGLFKLTALQEKEIYLAMEVPTLVNQNFTLFHHHLSSFAILNAAVFTNVRKSSGFLQELTPFMTKIDEEYFDRNS